MNDEQALPLGSASGEEGGATSVDGVHEAVGKISPGACEQPVRLRRPTSGLIARLPSGV
jgi:hypothetical protein